MRSGILRMVLASLVLSLMAALVKFVAPRIPTFEIILLRCALPLPLLAWLVRRRGLALVANNRRIVLVRSLMGITAMSLFFWGIGRVPIGDAMLLSRMQPVLVAVLAPLLLRERPTWVTLGCIAISVVGVFFILQPTFEVRNLGGIAVLGAGFASAVAHLAVRRLSADDDPMVIVLNFTVLTAIVALPLSLPSFVVPSATDAVALLFIAIGATVGQLLLTSAYALEQAPVVATAGYAAAVFGILWGYLFWHQIPETVVWLGGALVVSGGLLLLWSRRGAAAGAYVTPVGKDVP